MPDTARTTRFHTDSAGLSKVLADRLLQVPHFQRSYAWTNEEVREFWTDLRQSLAADQTEYFLGTVVLTGPSSARQTIIDGQQRLATTSMVLAAIRNALLTRGDRQTADMVTEKYLSPHDIETLSATPRLVLNLEDDTFFQAEVVDEGPNPHEPTTASHVRIRQAFELISEEVESAAGAAGDGWRPVLVKWVGYLLNSATVITVDVADEADAFLIFEALNYRGVPLTIVDLLKNYLFGRAQDKLPQVPTGVVGSSRSF